MQKGMVIRRLLTFFVLLITLIVVMGGQLFSTQVVNGEYYGQKSERILRRSTPVKASRGDIVDRNGRVLVTSRMGFSVLLDYVYWKAEGQNERLLQLKSLVLSHGSEYTDSLPVTERAPYRYIYENETASVREKFFEFCGEKLKLDPETTSADELLTALALYYEVDPALSSADIRAVVGMRYELDLRSFSKSVRVTFASDVDIALVSAIKERHLDFPGVAVDIEPIREYRTDYAANILGRVGPIYKEEYEKLKEQGYPMDATVGKDGVEYAFEQYLRGIDGVSTIETNIDGKVISVKNTKEPMPGGNVVLTIDIELQEVAEKALAARIQEIIERGEQSKTGSGADAKGGSAVVVDVKTGEILALAQYPTYSLKTFSADYTKLLADPLRPMLNRPISGAYPPGSTFKMATAVAGLQAEVVETDTIIVDRGIYRAYAPNYMPACWVYNDYGRTHGAQNVSAALKNSCNYFFFEVGRLLTIERLNEYAKKLGLGEYTGIELSGEARGILAGPESRERRGGERWQLGETIQAAIGQSDQNFTPLQLANYVATIANGGTRYPAHLLKQVERFDYRETVLVNTPEALDEIEMSEQNYRAVMEGMRSVTEDGTASSVFSAYPIAVGGKTGSAQVQTGSAHGVFVAFAPYDDPEIAVCVLVENAGSGNAVAPVARDIFDKYFEVSK